MEAYCRCSTSTFLRASPLQSEDAAACHHTATAQAACTLLNVRLGFRQKLKESALTVPLLPQQVAAAVNRMEGWMDGWRKGWMDGGREGGMDGWKPQTKATVSHSSLHTIRERIFLLGSVQSDDTTGSFRGFLYEAHRLSAFPRCQQKHH